jgi:glyoxylase-like metal-dependent hydrolase (beta-lactamase superfamily II)
MQELSSHVYIETGYAGVTLGAINWPHGLVLIDSPFRAEDVRSWRSALLNLGGGVDRVMVNLDAHLDRTLGARAMDCTIVAHEQMADVLRNRPVSFKAQGSDTGAEWELQNGLGSIRWAVPEITFSDRLYIHWDDSPLLLEHHPGPSTGAIWAILPKEKIAFIGDAILPNQPPFLAFADVGLWINGLELLLAPEYRDFLLVSGRGGLVAQQQIRDQIDFLGEVKSGIHKLAERAASPDEATTLAPLLVKRFLSGNSLEAQYEQRLKYGLKQYYIRHFRPNSEPLEE